MKQSRQSDVSYRDVKYWSTDGIDSNCRVQSRDGFTAPIPASEAHLDVTDALFTDTDEASVGPQLKHRPRDVILPDQLLPGHVLHVQECGRTSSVLCGGPCECNSSCHRVILRVSQLQGYCTLGMVPSQLKPALGDSIGVSIGVGLRDDGVLFGAPSKSSRERSTFSEGDVVRMEYEPHGGTLRWFRGLLFELGRLDNVPPCWCFGASGMSMTMEILQNLPPPNDWEQHVLNAREEFAIKLEHRLALPAKRDESCSKRRTEPCDEASAAAIFEVLLESLSGLSVEWAPIADALERSQRLPRDFCETLKRSEECESLKVLHSHAWAVTEGLIDSLAQPLADYGVRFSDKHGADSGTSIVVDVLKAAAGVGNEEVQRLAAHPEDLARQAAARKSASMVLSFQFSLDASALEPRSEWKSKFAQCLGVSPLQIDLEEPRPGEADVKVRVIDAPAANAVIDNSAMRSGWREDLGVRH